MSAPRSSSNCATSLAPPITARCSGWPPARLVLRARAGSASRNARTARASPRSAAACIGWSSFAFEGRMRRPGSDISDSLMRVRTFDRYDAVSETNLSDRSWNTLGTLLGQSLLRPAAGLGPYLDRVPLASKFGAHFDPSVEYSHFIVIVSPAKVIVARSFNGFPPTSLSAVPVHVLPFSAYLTELEFPMLSKNLVG